jgi:hypothetical protein
MTRRVRRPAAIAAALLAAVAAGLAAWLALRPGDEWVGPRGGILGATATQLPDVAARRLRVGATSLFDLAQRAPLRVRARGPATLRASLAPAGRSATVLGARVRLGAAARTVRLPVSAAAARAVAGCRPARLTLTLARGAHVVARRSTRLAPDPPACGRFFGPRAVWNRRADQARVDPRSATYVQELGDEVQREFGNHYPPTINALNYSAPVYTVPAGQPRVKVTMVGGRESYGGAIATQLAAGVPIPPGARAAWGGDHHMVVWQPATDTMWELWEADDSTGRWTAQWGGVMRHVSANPGYFSDPSGIEPGATATSLPLVGGLITRADVRRGVIDHALAMAIPNDRYAVWAHPAQRSDGGVDAVDAIPAGARFRLDPRVDVDSLDVPPFTRMLARAAQRYGIYVRDTSPVVTFYAEDPAGIGSDPWSGAIRPSAPEVLQAFPWHDLQVTRIPALWTYSNQRVPR